MVAHEEGDEVQKHSIQGTTAKIEQPKNLAFHSTESLFFDSVQISNSGETAGFSAIDSVFGGDVTLINNSVEDIAKALHGVLQAYGAKELNHDNQLTNDQFESILQRNQNEDVSSLNSNSMMINFKIALAFKLKGDFDEAISRFEDVISKNPDHKLAYLSQIFVAEICILQLKFQKAEDYLDTAVVGLTLQNNMLGVSSAYLELVILESKKKNFEASIKHANKAFLFAKNSEQTDEKHSLIKQVRAKINTGKSLINLNKLDDAAEELGLGLKLARKINYIRAQISALEDLAMIHESRNNFAGAQLLRRQSKTLRTNFNQDDEYFLAKQDLLVGISEFERKNFDSARTKFDSAIQKFMKMNLLSDLGIAYHEMARLEDDDQHVDEATHFYELSMEAFKKVGDKLNLMDCCIGYGGFCLINNRLDDAIRLSDISIEIAQSIADHQSHVDALWNKTLASKYLNPSNSEEIHRYKLQLKTLYEKHDLVMMDLSQI